MHLATQYDQHLRDNGFRSHGVDFHGVAVAKDGSVRIDFADGASQNDQTQMGALVRDYVAGTIKGPESDKDKQERVLAESDTFAEFKAGMREAPNGR